MVNKHNGQRIFYCKDIDEVSKILGVTVNDKHKRQTKNYVLMLSDEAGPVVIRNIADCFDDPENPFFDKKMASDYSLGGVIDEIIPDDIAKLMQDRNLLSEAQVVAHQGEDTGRKIICENLRFLLGFYRTENPKIREVGDLSN